jgi:hypothetical protein
MATRERTWKTLFAIALSLALIILSSVLLMPEVVEAEEISVTVTGDGVSTPTTFTQVQLEAMSQLEAKYSTISTYPTKQLLVARGVKLAELLNLAGIKDEASLIIVTATDGFKVTYTRKELLDDTRYYYPGLKDNHAYAGYITGSPEGAVRVDTILALASAEGDNFNNINSINAPVLMMGQRWVSEQTNHAQVKKVMTIEVSTASPGKWENPVATPAAGSVIAGSKVELTTPDMDGDSIYYTIDGSDPTFRSPMYNWIKKRWWNNRSDQLATINQAIEINEDMVIKAVAIGFGKFDSDIVIFNYQVSNPKPPQYILKPVAQNTYTVQTTVDGIPTMTVNSGISGLEYFTVDITPVTAHQGEETVVFTHWRKGRQININSTRADFDLLKTAQAGFNVMPGDLVKVYLLDELSNTHDSNPLLWQ